jgi:hypothetical protein
MSEKPTTTQKQSNNIELLGLLIAVLIGGFIRLRPVISRNFPLNDGGAFYYVIQEILAWGYAFPEFSSYNLNTIPFAYPPLAFYASALLSDLFQWPLLDLVRLLPGTISILTIPAFFLLCRRVLPNSSQIITATFAFTLLPTSFDWLVVGGGLTRSFGYLFAILTLHQIYNLYTTRQSKHIVLSSLFASLTILCHPGTAWFMGYSGLVIFAFHHKNQSGWLIKSLLVGISSLVLISPWLITLHNSHGLEVLGYPFQTQDTSLASILLPFTFLFSNEPLLDIFAIGGLLGVFAALYAKKYFLPVWLFSVFIFESRLGPTYSVVPMALLVGVGFDEIVLRSLSRPEQREISKTKKWLPKILMGYLLLYGLVAAMMAPDYGSISTNQRGALDWVRTNTHEDSRFVVITGQPEFGIDYVAEWFPALAVRHNLTTPQFHEWLPNEEFTQRIHLHKSLQNCLNHGLPCIQNWVAENNISFTHIFVANYPTNSSSPGYIYLTQSLLVSPEFEQIFTGPGGMVFQKK